MSLRARRLEKERLQREMEENLKKEKEIQAKINIKRTMASMKNQSQKLERFKKEYIEKARKATLVGDEQTCRVVKSGLKICLGKQKLIDNMIANLEISMQMNEINKVVGDFVVGMDTVAEQMKSVTPSIDMVKAQNAYAKAVENNAGQFQALDAFLEEASESIDAYAGEDSAISDEEIDALITSEAVSSENNIDLEIDQKINDIQCKLQV